MDILNIDDQNYKESEYYRSLKVLNNILGYPTSEIGSFYEKFPEITTEARNLINKLISARQIGKSQIDLNENDKLILYKSLDFIINNYDEKDFDSVMDGKREDYISFLKLLT